MMYFRYLACLALTCFTASLYGQQRSASDTLDTDIVNVVKPYTPKISDAFKIKAIPTLNDSITARKKAVQYNIFSIPVASTFTPAKGVAADVEKQAKERLFDNYASFGFGSYTSVLGDIYLNQMINRTERAGGYLSHHSSQGDIDGVILDNDFSDSRIVVNYGRSLRSSSWSVDAGYRHQVYNWYGTPDNFTQADLSGVDPKHKFFDFEFGGQVEFDNSAFNEGQVRFRRFADDYDSAENRVVADVEFTIPIQREDVEFQLKADYLKGNFDRSLFADEEINYGNFIVGTSFAYSILKDDWTVSLGASLFYLNDLESGKNKFYVYPNIKASYRLASDVLIAYGGIEGDLIQNTYRDLADENPFVSPTLNIMPSDNLYDAYVGLRGRLSNNMSYNIRGSYKATNNAVLYRYNPTQIGLDQNYQFGNSFGITYDDLDTFSVFGEINIDVNRNFNLGLKAEYFSYTVDKEAEAWNLPDFVGSLFMDYQIDAHWFAGASLYYIGERKDLFQIIDPLALPIAPETMTLESYFDANAHVGYRINDRWTTYVKANNIANQDYQRWLFYPVQGIQFLAGATYKFDF